MLSRKYQKLRSKSKGSLRIRRDFLPSIPVLSVFALLGIMSLDLILINSTSATEPETSDVDISPIADTNIPSPDDADISPLADTAALSIISGPADTAATAAGRGTTTYRTYTIGITSDNLESYNLTIYGDDELSYDATNKLTSANGANGNNLPADTWGYAFEELADSTSTGSANDALTYAAPLANNATTSLINNRPVNGTLNNYGKLVFAAKFGEDLPEGNYKANITLALTVTPRELITYTVTYNANGGSGSSSPASQSETSYDKTHSFIAASQGNLAKSGYNFLGWSESSNASSATYTAGSSKINLTSDAPTKTLYAVWRAIPTYNYRVSFGCNSGSGCPSGLNTSSTSTSYSYTIPSTIPTRTNYRFVGYSTNSSARTAEYAAGTTITLYSYSPSITLYAIWAYVTPFSSSLTTMQGMSSSICNSASIGATKTITDTRDNSSYTIRKHEDGRCWMTQNLRLTGSRTLTSSDSNISSSYTLPASNRSNFSTKTSTTNAVYYASNVSYGAYYSWYTATAGTNSSNASICPKGWKLPSQTDYINLTNSLGTNQQTYLNSPYNFTLPGYISGDSGPLDTNSTGDYWTSTNYSGSRAYQFRVATTFITYTNNSNYYRGLSIRCIAN